MRAGAKTGTGAARRPAFMKCAFVKILLTSSRGRRLRPCKVQERGIAAKGGLTEQRGFEPGLPADGRELAGLEILADGLVDLVLAGLRVRAAQLPCAQPAQLEDLEHVDEVDARREAEREERAHHQRPAEDQV